MQKRFRSDSSGLLFSETEMVKRYMRAAREDMDGPELLKLLQEIEDEITRRG